MYIDFHKMVAGSKNRSGTFLTGMSCREMAGKRGSNNVVR